MRFRGHPHAVKADIANMFHNIRVPDHQLTYLRFFWYEDNDPEKDIVEWISKVHLMGLTSTPAVANLAVRYAAREVPPRDGKTWMEEDDLLDPYHFGATRIPDQIEMILVTSFYVDDFLHSSPSEEHALRAIKSGIERLGRYHLDLCKVESNCDLIRKEFPSDQAKKTKISLTPADMTRPEPSLGHSSI